MVFAPGSQRLDDRPQTFADLGKAVLHPWRHLGIDLSDDQPVVFQSAQLLCEHTLGDSGHTPPQFAKALRARLQVKEDDAFPFAIDQIERGLDCAARSMRKITPLHWCFPWLFPIVSNRGLYPQIYCTCQADASAPVR